MYSARQKFSTCFDCNALTNIHLNSSTNSKKNIVKKNAWCTKVLSRTVKCVNFCVSV